jgi:hypothetical protein
VAERAQKGAAGGEKRGKGFTRRKGTGSHAALVFYFTLVCHRFLGHIPPVCVHTRAHTHTRARALTHTHTHTHDRGMGEDDGGHKGLP